MCQTATADSADIQFQPVAGIELLATYRNEKTVEVKLLPSIPNDYIEYIKDVGGYECSTYEDTEPGYAVLWSFEEIEQGNSDVEIDTYAPGFIAFGGDGGGELLVFDGTGAIFMLPMVGMEPDCAIRIAENFQELVSRFDI